MQLCLKKASSLIYSILKTILAVLCLGESHPVTHFSKEMEGNKKCKSYLTIASVLTIKEVSNIILDDKLLCKGGQLKRFTIKKKWKSKDILSWLVQSTVGIFWN